MTLDSDPTFDALDHSDLGHAQQLARAVSEIVSDGSLAAMEKLRRMCEAVPPVRTTAQSTSREPPIRVCRNCGQLLAANTCPRCDITHG